MSQIYRTGQGNEWSSLEGGGLEAAKWLGGIAAGALLMYLLDPERGSARRAQSVDAVRGLGARTSGALGNAWRGASERVGALAGDTRDAASDATDSSTLARAKQAVGETIDDVMERAKKVVDGAGDVLHDGKERASRALGTSADGAADTASGLADSASRSAARAWARTKDAVQEAVRPEPGAWGGTRRNVALAAGGLLAVTALLRRSPLGWVAGLAGAALLARGVANRPLGSLVPARALGSPLQQTIDFEQSIHIGAAPEELYDLWTDYESFPRFMSNVVEIRDLGRRRSHWTVRGPGGSEFAWNSVLTEQTRPRRLSWRSEPGAEIPQSGSVEFTPRRGGTDVTVRMSYTPPAGMLGHGLAMLLGSDPAARMHEDLARLKAYVERGVVPHDAAQSRAGSRYLH